MDGELSTLDDRVTRRHDECERMDAELVVAVGKIAALEEKVRSQRTLLEKLSGRDGGEVVSLRKGEGEGSVGRGFPYSRQSHRSWFFWGRSLQSRVIPFNFGGPSVFVLFGQGERGRPLWSRRTRSSSMIPLCLVWWRSSRIPSRTPLQSLSPRPPLIWRVSVVLQYVVSVRFGRLVALNQCFILILVAVP